MSILQDLYSSEINVSVESLWDCGFTVKIGDPLNGFRAEGRFDEWAAAEAWLFANAIALYPDSEFAKRHCLGGRDEQMNPALTDALRWSGGTAS